MRKNTPVLVLCFFLTALLSFNPSLWAVGSAGFENASYSAKNLAQANATVARAQDPSVALSNPAGLLELEGIQVSGGLQQLDWRIFHTNKATGDRNQNNAKLLLIPSMGLSINPGKTLNDRLAFGLAVNSPYGISSSFPSIGVGRYTGYENSLRMSATTMAGAFRAAKWLNLGAGATHYWIFDYGQRFNYPNSNFFGAGTPDGMGYTETDGHGWGWNLGALIKPLPKHKIGISYRSKANVQVNGRVVVEDLINGGAQGFPTFPQFQTGVHSDVSLPWNLTVGYAYEPSKKWAIETDFGITGWEVFKDQDFAFDQYDTTFGILRSLGTIPRDYNTSISVHLGGHYQATEKLDLQAGFAFYEAASPKIHFDNVIPDANRWLWTLGASYNWTPRFRTDLAYLFMLFGRRSISNPEVNAKSGTSIDGRYTSIIHGLMVNFTYMFDFPGDKKFQEKKEEKEDRNSIIEKTIVTQASE